MIRCNSGNIVAGRIKVTPSASLTGWSSKTTPAARFGGGGCRLARSQRAERHGHGDERSRGDFQCAAPLGTSRSDHQCQADRGQRHGQPGQDGAASGQNETGVGSGSLQLFEQSLGNAQLGRLGGGVDFQCQGREGVVGGSRTGAAAGSDVGQGRCSAGQDQEDRKRSGGKTPRSRRKKFLAWQYLLGEKSRNAWPRLGRRGAVDGLRGVNSGRAGLLWAIDV